ncbi:MAG TPA: hypothetical protein VHV27_01840 [Phenylobacterium sp.]|nr:hypothetical protein [Phenylobacterium sp.]
MAHDESAAPHRERPANGRLPLLGGIACACVLGAGLGLWARPVDGEQPGPPKPPAPIVETPSPTARHLQVVVDDTPAPLGKPLDVLPAAPPHAAVRPVAPIAPEPQAVKRPPFGLLRVVAPMLTPVLHAPKPVPPPAMEAPKPLPVVKVHAQPAKPKPAAAAQRLRIAQADHAQKATHTAAHSQKLAKASARHARPHVHEVELAQAPPPPKPRRALLALAHAFVKLAAHHARAEAEDRADAAPDHARRASLREVHLTRPAAHPKTKIERFIPPLNTKGAGPIRVSSVTTRCASPDPGEALVCGDPSLGAAQRRLNRAYHDAETAGVPAATLEQQQQRWLSARAAAAREAPWAVREVYQARIAELQDMTRTAQGN